MTRRGSARPLLVNPTFQLRFQVGFIRSDHAIPSTSLPRLDPTRGQALAAPNTRGLGYSPNPHALDSACVIPFVITQGEVRNDTARLRVRSKPIATHLSQTREDVICAQKTRPMGDFYITLVKTCFRGSLCADSSASGHNHSISIRLLKHDERSVS